MHVRDLVRGMARGTMCVEAATLCTKAGLPREADGGATAAAAARLRRLLTEETVGLPTQAERSS